MERRFYVGHTKNKGQAALIAVVLILFISLGLVFGFVTIALSQAQIAKNTLAAKQSYMLAESGIEDAIFRIKSGKNISSTETITMNGSTVQTTVADVAGTKEIISNGDISSAARRLKVVMQNSVGTNFPYGVQVGNGGLAMSNSSRVNGSVYSNGNIIGSNSATIAGDALVATTSVISGMIITGNARAYSINNTSVTKSASTTADFTDSSTGKHAYANIIDDSTIGRNAYYQTSIISSSVGGSSNPGTPAPSELPPLSMPILDADLDAWETVAVAGGTISSPCPYAPASGTVIGPKKINCDMVLSGTTVVTLTGPIWIAGNLTMSNSAQLKLDSSFGINSTMVIIDNPSDRLTSSKFDLSNSAQVLGSGTAGSYVLIASRNDAAENNNSTIAIRVGNSSAAPIYFAPHGAIDLYNNISLKEVTGYKLQMSNAATVTYESGLANVQFSSGPSGGWGINTWQEIQ
jgi:hypothetical protein